MVTAEELAARREQIAAAPDLAALLAHLTERAPPLLAGFRRAGIESAALDRRRRVPEDGAGLAFDP